MNAPNDTAHCLTAASPRPARLVDDWNDTDVDPGGDLTLPEMFDAQARRTPEAVAVQGDRDPLTYDQLRCRADALAAGLVGRRIGPGSLVAICAERSPEMLVGLLGILKAGAAYVPLDLSYPPARITYMIEHSRAALLLTQRGLLGMLPPHPAPVACLEDYATGQAAAAVVRAPAPEDLAYVIYTSGSTGHPKGVRSRTARWSTSCVDARAARPRRRGRRCWR